MTTGDSPQACGASAPKGPHVAKGSAARFLALRASTIALALAVLTGCGADSTTRSATGGTRTAATDDQRASPPTTTTAAQEAGPCPIGRDLVLPDDFGGVSIGMTRAEVVQKLGDPCAEGETAGSVTTLRYGASRGMEGRYAPVAILLDVPSDRVVAFEIAGSYATTLAGKAFGKPWRASADALRSEFPNWQEERNESSTLLKDWMHYSLWDCSDGPKRISLAGSKKLNSVLSTMVTRYDYITDASLKLKNPCD